jgi:hypothetical protein
MLLTRCFGALPWAARASLATTTTRVRALHVAPRPRALDGWRVVHHGRRVATSAGGTRGGGGNGGADDGRWTMGAGGGVDREGYDRDDRDDPDEAAEAAARRRRRAGGNPPRRPPRDTAADPTPRSGRARGETRDATRRARRSRGRVIRRGRATTSGGSDRRREEDRVPISTISTNHHERRQARSIHWSPYDRVGVVNADP